MIIVPKKRGKLQVGDGRDDEDDRQTKRRALEITEKIRVQRSSLYYLRPSRQLTSH